MISSTRFYTALLLLAVFAISSCKKEKEQTPIPLKKGIFFTDSTINGRNVLTLPDSITLLSTINYGFDAKLEKDAELYIVITNLSPLNPTTGKISMWGYLLGSNVGWIVNSYNTSTNTQKFSALNSKNDLSLILIKEIGSPGMCRIDFYENATSVTKTRYLKW